MTAVMSRSNSADPPAPNPDYSPPCPSTTSTHPLHMTAAAIQTLTAWRSWREEAMTPRAEGPHSGSDPWARMAGRRGPARALISSRAGAASTGAATGAATGAVTGCATGVVIGCVIGCVIGAAIGCVIGVAIDAVTGVVIDAATRVYTGYVRDGHRPAMRVARTRPGEDSSLPNQPYLPLALLLCFWGINADTKSQYPLAEFVSRLGREASHLLRQVFGKIKFAKQQPYQRV